jgi:hypothetical protein
MTPTKLCHSIDGFRKDRRGVMNQYDGICILRSLSEDFVADPMKHSAEILFMRFCVGNLLVLE